VNYVIIGLKSKSIYVKSRGNLIGRGPQSLSNVYGLSFELFSEGVYVILIHYRDMSHICHHPLEAYRDMFILWDLSDEMCH